MKHFSNFLQDLHRDNHQFLATSRNWNTYYFNISTHHDWVYCPMADTACVLINVSWVPFRRLIFYCLFFILFFLSNFIYYVLWEYFIFCLCTLFPRFKVSKYNRVTPNDIISDYVPITFSLLLRSFSYFLLHRSFIVDSYRYPLVILTPTFENIWNLKICIATP